MKMLSALAALSLLTAPLSPAFAAAPAAAVVPAPAWTVDPQGSSIVFKATSSGAGFQGSFRRWTADIRFDPANLAGSSAKVTIDLSSAATNDRTRDETLAQGEWFGKTNGVFQATTFKSLGANKYEATGTLTIKNVAYPVVLPFTLNIAGADADMSGSVQLDRVKMNLGLQTDPKAEWISRAVTVNVHVKAKRAK